MRKLPEGWGPGRFRFKFMFRFSRIPNRQDDEVRQFAASALNPSTLRLSSVSTGAALLDRQAAGPQQDFEVVAGDVVVGERAVLAQDAVAVDVVAPGDGGGGLVDDHAGVGGEGGFGVGGQRLAVAVGAA